MVAVEILQEIKRPYIRDKQSIHNLARLTGL